MNTTLYPGIPFSPQAQLTNNIGAADTIIEVSDVSAFPPAPNLATIGTDEEGETILYTAKTETALSGCQRGVEGEARGWMAGELIGRNFTAKDHADLIAAATEAYGAAQTAQPKLTGQTGQVVGFGADGAAVAVPGWSNQNRLLNWDFRNPVNRNGKTEYAGAGYTIDRWNTTNQYCKLQVNQGYISLLSAEPGVQSVWLQQQIKDPNQYFGKLMTFSALLQDDTLLSCSGVIPIDPVSSNTGFHSNAVNGVDLYVFKRASGTACVQISALKTGPGQTDIVACKLELGPIQTLAHQDADGNWVLNDPPDYDLQYALCSLYSPITGEWVGSQHSNPNLLDNWYFADPVNQRGQTEYTTSGYTIDRWFLYNSPSAKLLESGIQIKANPDSSQIVQRLPLGCIKKNTLLTLSILDTDWELVTCTGRAALSVDSGFFVNTSWGWIAFRNMQSTPFWEAVYTTNVDKVFIAAKLELGPVQTLAHQDASGNWVLNDPPPNKALELTKCQRYQTAFRCASNYGYSQFGIAYAVSDTMATVQIPISVQMRIAPVLKFGGSYQLFDGSSHPAKNISLASATTDKLLALLVTSSGLVQGRAYAFSANNDAAAYLLADANL